MTKEQLLTFIDNNYQDGEELVWQVLSKFDVQNNLGIEVDDNKWSLFIEFTHDDSTLSDDTSDLVSECFEMFDRAIYPQMV